MCTAFWYSNKLWIKASTKIQIYSIYSMEYSLDCNNNLLSPYVASVIIWLIFDDYDGPRWRPSSFLDSWAHCSICLVCFWRFPGNSPWVQSKNQLEWSEIHWRGQWHEGTRVISRQYSSDPAQRKRERICVRAALSLPWFLLLGHSSVHWWILLSLHLREIKICVFLY